MIEESGENWYYEPESERPSIMVIATVQQIEHTETVERTGKQGGKRQRKRQPFGFARALPKQKRKG